MKKKFTAPRGTTDILPSEIPLWEKIEAKCRNLLQTYGYQQIRPPLFEETELFARSMGQTSDVVQKQMLNLVSQALDSNGHIQLSGLSLRPEATASVVRAYIQHNMDKKESLTKLFYFGPMFRGERPQKGRLRQFHQVGVEVLGADAFNPYLDAEVIALAVGILEAIGIKKREVHLNTLGTQKDKERFSKELRRLLQPSYQKLCEFCQSRFERNVFRILDCKHKGCQDIVRKTSVSHQYLSPESQEYYKAVKKALDCLGISYRENPLLVRGLDYYTHTVFEITAENLGSQDAVGAGGRYNNLVSQLGGDSIPAVGFALGIERMILAAQANGAQAKGFSSQAFLIALDEDSLEEMFIILQKLRQEGISSDMSYRSGSLKSHMRLANKKEAAFVVLMGENERQKGTVTVKNMATGQQQEISIKEKDYHLLIQHLKGE